MAAPNCPLRIVPYVVYGDVSGRVSDWLTLEQASVEADDYQLSYPDGHFFVLHGDLVAYRTRTKEEIEATL